MRLAAPLALLVSAAFAASDAAAQGVVQASATGPASAVPQTAQYQAAQPQTALTALGQTNLIARQRAAMAAAGAVIPHPTTPVAARPASMPPAGAAGPATRPFAGTVPSRSPISPYMNLFRTDEIDGVPNYFAFVRPQLDQQRAAAEQAQEIARLQQQLQRSGGAAGYGGRTTTGGYGAARYGDTAHYYRGWQR